MIRDLAAINCARRVLTAALPDAEPPTDEMVALAASVIQNLVAADELDQVIERKTSVVRLIGGAER